MNEVVVAYRGSHNIDNWINDMNAIKINYQRSGSPADTQVHAGFYNVYSTMQSQTQAAVKTLLSAHPTASIVLTGHSLGAAVATFSAIDIKLAFPSHKINFYTFGSPRPGNQAFSDFVTTLFPGSQYNRVVHDNDIVPHLPIIAMGFNHAGTEIWYNTETSFKTCLNQIGSTENKACSDSLTLLAPSAHKLYLGIKVTGQCDIISSTFTSENSADE